MMFRNNTGVLSNRLGVHTHTWTHTERERVWKSTWATDYLYLHDTEAIHHHGTWLVFPLPSSPPLALHHRTDWIIVLCYSNAHLCSCPQAGATAWDTPVTPGTDGSIIVDTHRWSSCFVIRLTVISCGLLPFHILTFISPSEATGGPFTVNLVGLTRCRHWHWFTFSLDKLSC